MVDTVYLQVLDMSKTACFVIAAVLLLRLMLKKAPKILSYGLWLVVLLRLLCPVALEMPVSLLPEMESVSENYTLSEEPISIFGAGEAAYRAVGDALNGGLGAQHVRTTEKNENKNTRYVTTDWWSVWVLFGKYVWVAGVAAMLLYSGVSYISIRKRLAAALPLRDNIYTADDITAPFVVGLLHPKIYLPCGLGEREQAYIILHEQHHIKRFDHIAKMLAFLALSVHWFNPLVWVAFTLSSQDMEMSCDEAVIRRLGREVRGDYCASLLTFATGRRIMAGAPLAFGEGDVKGRIRNIAKWKKPAVWAVVLSVIACLGLAVGLLTDPVGFGDHIMAAESSTTAGSNRLLYEVRLGKQVKSGKLYAERWVNGECVSSNTIPLYQSDKQIAIVLTERRENGAVVGTEIQIETTPPNGSTLLTYFPHPAGQHISGWAFKGYEMNEKVRLSPDRDMILAAMVFDIGNGVLVFDCDTLANEPERLEKADNIIVIRCAFREDPLDMTYEEAISAQAPAQPPAEAIAEAVEEAITKAVLEYNRSDKSAGLIPVESHVILAQEKESGDKVTVYMLVHYAEYSSYGGELSEVGGSYIPTAITFRSDGGEGYTVEEYWVPRDGSYYAEDIRSKFPCAVNEEACIGDLKAENYQKALGVLHESGSLDMKIAALFETVCESPHVYASDLKPYLQAHKAEYDLLLSYGEYTLQYCFGEFLQGEQTDLRGEVMALACQDIMLAWGEGFAIDQYPVNGQEWFDAFRSSAENLAGQYSAEELEKYYPASYRLLEMTRSEYRLQNIP